MAVIGIAFSLGFLIGPMVGAGFSVWAKSHASLDWYIYPAGIALTLSLLDLLYIFIYFKETLPEEERLPDLTKAIKQSFSYINPGEIARHPTLEGFFSKPRNLAKSIFSVEGLKIVMLRNTQRRTLNLGGG